MTEARKRTALGPSFAAVLILFATAAVWTETCLIGVNSLYQNDRWIVEKRMMIGGVGGADEFLINRDAIAGRVLHLGNWQGLHQIYSREKLELRTLRAEVRIGSEAHLDIFYNRGAGGSSGIRLSGKSAGPAFSFLVNHDGEFLSKEPIATPELDDRWHSIELSGSGQEVLLRIDGGSPLKISRGFSVGSIGFGGDLGQIEVREISADSSQGPWREDFANRKNRVGGIAFSLLFLVLLSYLVSALSARSPLPSLKSATLATTSLGLSLLALCAIWLAFDTQFLARRPFSGITHAVFPGSPPSLPLLDRLDALRFSYFNTWFRFFGGESTSPGGISRRGYPMIRFWGTGPSYCSTAGECSATFGSETVPIPEKAGGTYRILVVGSSQTVGAGAESVEKTWFAVFQRALQARLSSLARPIKLDIINEAHGAWTADLLFGPYPEQLRRANPDLVLINLGNTDQVEGFEQRMRAFLDLNRSKRIRTALVLEAHFKGNANLILKHDVLKRLGAEYQLPLFPLHDYLASPAVAGSGLLWWDVVHLTSWGQRRVGEWLAQQVAPVVGSYLRGK